jgi:hypothetical protein
VRRSGEWCGRPTFCFGAQLVRVAVDLDGGVGYGTCEVTVNGPNLIRRPGKGGIMEVAMLSWFCRSGCGCAIVGGCLNVGIDHRQQQ